MKSYIGCKIIQAEPCSEYDAIGDKEWESDRPNRPGYRVVYPDGYVSWSPKDVFENAYREITNSEKELIGD